MKTVEADMLRFTRNKFLLVHRRPELLVRLTPNELEQYTLHILRNYWFLVFIYSTGLMILSAAAGWFFNGATNFGSAWNWTPLVLAVVLWPLANFLRNQVYKANWRGAAVNPSGYRRANLIKTYLQCLIPVLVVYFFMSFGPSLPAIMGGLLWMILHRTDYPSGLPMQPTPPRLGQKES